MKTHYFSRGFVGFSVIYNSSTHGFGPFETLLSDFHLLLRICPAYKLNPEKHTSVDYFS